MAPKSGFKYPFEQIKAIPKVDMHINLTSSISTDLAFDLSMDDNYKLCKIVGVILDNAIEASKDVRDKCVMISLYLDVVNIYK